MKRYVFSAEDEKRLELLLADGLAIGELTDDQKAAVLATGKVLVSASAGSGKTSTMIKRILLAVAEGKTLERMLVLVYNNAAADELRDRLRSDLFDAACRSTGRLRDAFRKQLDELDFCHIGTIHSFCQSLIRENFDKLGISPSFQVLDENSHTAYINKAFDAVFDAYAQENDGVFDDLTEIFSQGRKEERLRDTLLRLFSLYEIQPDKEAFAANVEACFKSYDNNAFFDVLLNSYKRTFAALKRGAEAALSALGGYNQPKYCANLENLIRFCADMRNACDIGAAVTLAKAGYEKVSANRGRSASEDEKVWTARAKAYCSCADEEIKSILSLFSDAEYLKAAHGQNGIYASKMMEVVLRFDRELSSLKLADSVASFGDLERYAAILLKENADAVQEYDCVFVDEYQDVNPVQEYIISRVSGGESFMVGDVKQSIYGFRLADPSIFLRRLSQYDSGGGTAISFNRNFRSGSRILAFVNSVFDAVMTCESADVDYKNGARFSEEAAFEGNVELHLFVKQPRPEAPAPEGVYDITADGQSEQEDDACAQEGRFIANEIRSLLNRAKSGGGYVGYDDIALLFRSRNAASQKIIAELKACGIPVDEGSFTKSETLAERELTAFLRVLDNPRQDIPLAGFLLSYFGGYSESDLAFIAAYGGRCLYDKLKACAQSESELGLRLGQTLNLLSVYRVKSSFKHVSELMSGIVSDFSYEAYLMRRGEANVYALKSFISSAQQLSGITLGRFVSEYAQAPQKGATAGGNRVHASTFHGYKGLEKPVVFVADTAGIFNRQSVSGDFLAEGNGFIGLSFFDFEKKIKRTSLSQAALSRMINERETKEQMRLLYVALTRAKQYLYVTASVSQNKADEFGVIPRVKSAGCDLDFISDAYCSNEACAPVYRHTSCDSRRERADYSPLPTFGAADETVLSAAREALDFVYPHKESTRLAMKYSVSVLDGMSGDGVRVYEEGASVGTAYHKAMQYIDFEATKAEEAEAQLDLMTREDVVSADERKLVDARKIAACLSSDVMRLAAKSKCLREKAFMTYRPANEVSESFNTSDKVLVQGVVDLIILGERNVIVDFKYSALKDADTVKKYKKQLELYKNAIESALSVKIDAVALYSFVTGETLFT